MTLKVSIPGPIGFCRYVWGLKYYILAVLAIFTVFYAVGYLAAVSVPQIGDTLMSNFKDEVSPLKALSPVGMMLGIFANNALKCLLVIALGLILGIVPLVFVVANGLIIGIVVGVTVSRAGPLYVLVGMAPHGIIELPMVFISSAIGLKLGADVLKALLGRREGLLDKVKEAMLIYVVWIFPLLFLAALIETFVTGPLLYLLFGGHG